ncbi:MAG: hypothetical protein ACXABY_27705 [Candidatus Thorarchaeota archaeon]|jgi:hypothetical protein
MQISQSLFDAIVAYFSGKPEGQILLAMLREQQNTTKKEIPTQEVEDEKSD